MWNDAPIGFSCYLWQLSKLKSSKKLCLVVFAIHRPRFSRPPWLRSRCLRPGHRGSGWQHPLCPEVCNTETRTPQFRAERVGWASNWQLEPRTKRKISPCEGSYGGLNIWADFTVKTDVPHTKGRRAPTSRLCTLRKSKNTLPIHICEGSQDQKASLIILCISRACLRTYRGFYIRDIWERKSALSCLISDVSELSSLKNKWFCNIC